MKIAVAYDNGDVHTNFGMAKEFKLYHIEDGKIAADEVVASTKTMNKEYLVELLTSHGVTDVICSGIPSFQKNVLAKADITVSTGASGNADQQVRAFLLGDPLGDPCNSCGYIDPESGKCEKPADVVEC